MSRPDFVPSDDTNVQKSISSSDWAHALFGEAPEPSEEEIEIRRLPAPSISDLLIEPPSVPSELEELVAPTVPNQDDHPVEVVPKFTSDMLMASRPEAVGRLMDYVFDAGLSRNPEETADLRPEVTPELFESDDLDIEIDVYFDGDNVE